MRGYHRRVQQGIKLFAEHPDNKNHFLSVNLGSKIFRIHHPTNGKLAPLEYKPDATITPEKRSKIVFQVLDSQARKNREIEADMIRAFLSPEVSIMVFVVESPEYAKNVNRISAIISDNLVDSGVPGKKLPLTIALAIPRGIRSAEEATKHLKKIRGKILSHL